MTTGTVPGRLPRLVLLAGAITSAAASADDRTDDPVNEDDGYLELGVAWRADRSILARLDDNEAQGWSRPAWGVSLAGALRLGPVFAEGRRGGLDGVSLGLTLHRDERRALELLAVHAPGGIDEIGYSSGGGGDVDSFADERSRDGALLERNDLYGANGMDLPRPTPGCQRLATLLKVRDSSACRYARSMPPTPKTSSPCCASWMRRPST